MPTTHGPQKHHRSSPRSAAWLYPVWLTVGRGFYFPCATAFLKVRLFMGYLPFRASMSVPLLRNNPLRFSNAPSSSSARFSAAVRRDWRDLASTSHLACNSLDLSSCECSDLMSSSLFVIGTLSTCRHFFHRQTQISRSLSQALLFLLMNLLHLGHFIAIPFLCT